MVTVGTFQPMPAPMALWRAGFWPAPACRTWPMITASTCSASTPLAARAALMACAPSSTAVKLASCPFSRPCGVRAAARMTTSLLSAELLMVFSSDLVDYAKVIVSPSPIHSAPGGGGGAGAARRRRRLDPRAL